MWHQIESHFQILFHILSSQVLSKSFHLIRQRLDEEAFRRKVLRAYSHKATLAVPVSQVVRFTVVYYLMQTLELLDETSYF